MSERVTIVIDQQGKATISVSGVCGSACKELTRPLEQALGTVADDRVTTDMFRPAAQQTQGQHA